jgi:hypothetical protein
VTFSIWEKNNADGKGSGLYDWTSLMGDEKKKLLINLPEKLDSDVIQRETVDDVKRIWVVCQNLTASFLIIFLA